MKLKPATYIWLSSLIAMLTIVVCVSLCMVKVTRLEQRVDELETRHTEHLEIIADYAETTADLLEEFVRQYTQ